MPGRQQLTGWLAFGGRQSNEPYSVQDLRFLESLCDQAAQVVERSQVIANMEARVHQMDVLARVSQGINVTLALDDILELIYAQIVAAAQVNLVFFPFHLPWRGF